MQATDFNEAELTGWSCGKTARNKYHFYHQGHGICPKATGTTWVVIKDWAKYDGKPNCCATCLALLALAAPIPEQAPVAEQEPAPFDYIQQTQHFADVRVQQDREAGVAEGWASTKPGHTKHHYYQKGGKSLCNYQRQKGQLHYSDRKLPDWQRCEACDNHLKRKPELEPVTLARPRLVVATGPQPVQLNLF